MLTALGLIALAFCCYAAYVAALLWLAVRETIQRDRAECAAQEEKRS